VPPAGPRQTGTLYCIDSSGTVRTCLSGQDLRPSCGLQAGLFGSMVLVTPERTCVIHNGKIYTGKDLHELAARQFSLLLELAPQQSESNPFISDFGWQKGWSWLACDGVLWVAWPSRVEAYREGKPLLIERRLNLLGARPERPLLFGPLGQGENRRIVIACHPTEPLRSVWATQKPDGIELEPARYPSHNMISDGLVVGISHIEGPCLVDHRNGRIFYYRFTEDYLWEVSGPANCVFHHRLGQPVLVADDGRLLVNRQARGFEGFRWFEPGSVTDILLTYVEPLRITLRQHHGEFLCLTPDGVAWIRPDETGQYVITRRLHATMRGVPSEYIGRSARTLYLRTSMREIVAIPTGDRAS
jgi:hypothetical protein